MRWDTERDTLSLGFGQMNIEKKVRGAKKPSKRDLSTPEGISAAMEEGAITRRKIPWAEPQSSTIPWACSSR
jgi:hypothetical protein